MRAPAYARPSRIEEALEHLGRHPCTILAGGTDYFPARVGRPAADPILDVTAIPGLRGIKELEDHWRIGATATWSDVLAAKLPPLFDGLKLAAREIGGVQIQNRGTLAGNICNASPAADGVPVLLSLDAGVELASVQGVRVVPLERFICAPRSTVRRPDELVTAVRVPRPRRAARGSFLKLGARRYLVISISMVGVVVEIEDHIVQRACVAVGSCSAVACRVPHLEFALTGKPLDGNFPAIARREHFELLAPIDDVRASAAYRMDATLTLVRRALASLLQ